MSLEQRLQMQIGQLVMQVLALTLRNEQLAAELAAKPEAVKPAKKGAPEKS
jgi:hypothetical protein